MHVGLDARFADRGLGIGRFVIELARALVEIDGLHVTWLGSPRVAPGGVEVHDLGRLPHPLLDLAPGHRIVRGLDVDVMHFTGNTGWLGGGPVPTVLTIHDVMFLERGAGLTARQRLGRTYVSWNVRRAAAAAGQLASVSEQAARETSAALGLTRTPRVVPHGTALLPPVAPREGRVVAFAGSDPRKGTWDLLEFVRREPAGLRELVLLAGAGLPDGFREAAASELATGRIRIEDWLDREQVVRWVASAVVLVHPTRDEGFGLPVLEAMSWGTPVVTGLAPATLEVGGDAVLRIDPSDVVGSLVHQTERLLSDAELRRQLVATSQARASRYGWDAAARSYVDLYRAAVEAGGTASP